MFSESFVEHTNNYISQPQSLRIQAEHERRERSHSTFVAWKNKKDDEFKRKKQELNLRKQQQTEKEKAKEEEKKNKLDEADQVGLV